MNSSSSITILDASHDSLRNYITKLWKSRPIAVLLFRREIKIKYAQTLLGILWALVQPLTGLLIFSVIFGRLIKIDTNGAGYPLFAFTGMVSWFLFSQIVSGTGHSLIESQQLIQKIYFPRMILLIVKCMVATAEFLVSLVLLFIALMLTGKYIQWQIVYLPFFICITIITGLSVGIWLGALTIRNRDFLHLVPYLVNFGIWFTPVFYPDTIIPPGFKWAIFLNPMAASMACFRWAVLGTAFPDMKYLFSLIPVALLLVSGFNYFRKTDEQIADYL